MIGTIMIGKVVRGYFRWIFSVSFLKILLIPIPIGLILCGMFYLAGKAAPAETRMNEGFFYLLGVLLFSFVLFGAICVFVAKDVKYVGGYTVILTIIECTILIPNGAKGPYLIPVLSFFVSMGLILDVIFQVRKRSLKCFYYGFPISWIGGMITVSLVIPENTYWISFIFPFMFVFWLLASLGALTATAILKFPKEPINNDRRLPSI